MTNPHYLADRFVKQQRAMANCTAFQRGYNERCMLCGLVTARSIVCTTFSGTRTVMCVCCIRTMDAMRRGTCDAK